MSESKEVAKSMGDAMVAMTLAMRSVGQAFCRLRDKIGESWMCLAESMYLQHHARLPGSTRTARLRKKRATKVLNWFSDYLDGCRNSG